MVSLSVEGKERTAQVCEELDIRKACTFHLQQSHYHNVCRPHRPWQHAGPLQNGQEQWQLRRYLETAACAYHKQAADNTAYAGYKV